MFCKNGGGAGTRFLINSNIFVISWAKLNIKTAFSRFDCNDSNAINSMVVFLALVEKFSKPRLTKMMEAPEYFSDNKYSIFGDDLGESNTKTIFCKCKNSVLNCNYFFFYFLSLHSKLFQITFEKIKLH